MNIGDRLRHWWRTTRRVFLEPEPFLAEVESDVEGYHDPAIFAGITLLVSALIAAALLVPLGIVMAGGTYGAPTWELIGASDVPQGIWFSLTFLARWIPLVLTVGLLGLWLLTGYTELVYGLLEGDGTMLETFTVHAYLMPYLAAALPVTMLWADLIALDALAGLQLDGPATILLFGVIVGLLASMVYHGIDALAEIQSFDRRHAAVPYALLVVIAGLVLLAV